MGANAENVTYLLFRPKDPKLVHRLTAKLEEYRGRIDWSNVGRHQATTIYKFRILEAILRDGVVDLFGFLLELHDEYGWYDSRRWEIAQSVIADYCNTGGENVMGGGL